MWILCKNETDKDPFLELYPATGYTGDRSQSSWLNTFRNMHHVNLCNTW